MWYSSGVWTSTETLFRWNRWIDGQKERRTDGIRRRYCHCCCQHLSGLRDQLLWLIRKTWCCASSPRRHLCNKSLPVQTTPTQIRIQLTWRYVDTWYLYRRTCSLNIITSQHLVLRPRFHGPRAVHTARGLFAERQVESARWDHPGSVRDKWP